MSLNGPILGLDLGSFSSACAVFRDGRARPIPSAQGGLLTPTVVGEEAGRVRIGQMARELRAVRPDACAWGFLGLLGSTRRLEWAGMQSGAVSLTSLCLASLRDDAERSLGVPVDRAVLCVPPELDGPARDDLETAARLAGLRHVELLGAPIALAYSFPREQFASDGNWLVCDFGASGARLSLLEVFDGGFECLASERLESLGGDRVTGRFVERALSWEHRGARIDSSAPAWRATRIWDEVERAKEQLARQEHAVFRVPDPAGALGPRSRSYLLSRDELVAEVLPPGIDLEGAIARVLQEARLEPRAVDGCLVGGGGAELPEVATRLRERLGWPVERALSPSLAGSLGAAARAAELALAENLEERVSSPLVARGGSRRCADRDIELLQRAETCLTGLTPGARAVLIGLMNSHERALRTGRVRVLAASRRVLSLYLEHLASSTGGEAA